MKNVAAFILLLIFVLSCNDKKEVIERNPQNINQLWILVEFQDYKKDFLAENNAFLDLTNVERASAKMGCNSLSFSYNARADYSIEFSQENATKMFCKDNLNLEESFIKQLSLVKTYEVKKRHLTLLTSNNEKLVFVAQDEH